VNALRDAWYVDNLCCPDCRKPLRLLDQGVECSVCSFAKTAEGCFDLRPITPRSDYVGFARTMSQPPSARLYQISTNRPAITYDGPRAVRDSSELLSEIMRYLDPPAAVLDLGCGPRDQAVPVQHIGHRYVGVDYSNTSADFLADAHAIPFRDATFDCVLSYAVLEHLHNPFVAIREIERVLKLGGIYVGTVSQGEPFHESYFHHTAWGFMSLVESTTVLRVRRLWSSMDTLAALARMGRYPRAVRRLIQAVHVAHEHLPFLAPRKMRWSPKDKELDEVHRAGSVCFVAERPA